MEDQDRGLDGVNRRSPRFAVRKVAARMTSNTSTEESAGVPVNKKRKRLGKERNQGNGPSKKKQVIAWKCCPQMLYDLIKRLSPDQKKWVEELGFGCLLLMKEVRIPKILTLWLINQVDCKKKCLVIRGKRFKISEWIAHALGVPKGDLKVPLPRSGRGKAKIRNPTEEEKEFRAADGGRGIKVKDIINALIAENDVTKFKKQFMLVVLCIYLAPTSGHFINRSYLAALVNIDQVKDMDWCEFIASYLVDGIRDYLESPAANVNVHGCVHLLPLMYIAIVHSQQLQVPNQNPLIQCVSTELLELLESLDMQHDEYGEPIFGNLEIKPELKGDAISDFSENDSPRKAPRLTRHPQAQMKLKSAARQPAPMVYNSQAARRSSNSPKRLKRDTKEKDQMAMATTIDEVESQYSLERAKVYQRCFDLMNKRVAKLDMKRKSAIQRLMNQNGKVEESNLNIATSTGRVTEATKVDSVQQHPLNLKDSTDGKSLESSHESGRPSVVGSPSALKTIAIEDRTPGVLSKNNHIGVDNQLHNTSSSDGHSTQLVADMSQHDCSAADGASTEVCTSSDVPNNSANLPPHVDTRDQILGHAVQNELSPFDVLNMHEDFLLAMCLQFHKKVSNANNTELSRFWINHTNPWQIKMDGVSLRSETLRKGYYSIDFSDLILRVYTKRCDKIYLTRKRHTHYMPNRWSHEALMGHQCGGVEHTRKFFMGDFYKYDLENIYKIVVPVDIDNKKSCYFWDMRLREITVLDPMMMGKPEEEIKEAHETTVNDLHHLLFECIEEFYPRWDISKERWGRVYRNDICAPCKWGDTGLFSMYFAAHFDGDELTRLDGLDNLQALRARHLWDALSLEGNSGQVPHAYTLIRYNDRNIVWA